MLFLSHASLFEQDVVEAGTKGYTRRRGDLVWRERPNTHILRNLTREPVTLYEIEFRLP